MKKQHLVILGVVLVLLIGLRLAMHRRGSDVATDIGEAGLARLVAADVDESKVAWIRVSGPAPKEGEEAARPLELVRGDAGWTVTSAEGAPADESLVKDFVHRAVELAGEVRGEGEAAFDRFGVGAATGTKVELGEAAGQPVATLWIGKPGDDGDAHFARLEGSTEVRHVQDGVRALLQLYSESARPAPDLWVNKVVVDVKPEDVRKVVVERPDATLVLERETAPTPPVDGSSGPTPPPEPKWRIVSPEMPWVVQVDALDGVVSRAARVRVASILPAGSPACSFDAPGARSTIERADGTSASIRLGAKVADKEEVALQVEGQPLCYAMGTWSVQSVLPRASSLWTIPQVFPDAASAGEPRRVRVQRGGTTHVLARSDGGEWTIESPSKGPADTARATRLSSAVKNLRIDDVGEAARIPTASLATEATITVEMKGKTLTVHVLGERHGAFGDRYVRTSGATPMAPGWIGVISKATVDSLLPSADELKEKAAPQE